MIAGGPTSRAQRRRVIAAATVGNALEFYDFLVYAYFAIEIGRAFFPAHNATYSLLASLGTFGAGFVSRPLGAWWIGGLADRHGRKPALTISLWLMGLGIAGLALTPSYASIGWPAPAIVILARLVQGFALGGEIGPSTALLVEAADDANRGLVASLQRVTQLGAGGIGAAVGLTISLALSEAQVSAWGWRLALGLGLAIVPYAAWVRRNLPEPPRQEGPARRAPSGTTNWRLLGLGFVIFAAGSTSSYVLGYLATFGQASLGMAKPLALGGQLLAYVGGVTGGLFAGHASDRIGRRPVLMASALLMLVLLWPGFAWVIATPMVGPWIVVCLGLGFANGLTSVGVVAIAEMLDPATRARHFASCYTAALILFGGTAQGVVTWLILVTGNKLAIAWYVMALMLPALAAMIALPESAPGRRRGDLSPIRILPDIQVDSAS